MHHLIYSFLNEYDQGSQLMHGHKRIYQKNRVIVALFSTEQMSMLSGQEPVIMQNTNWSISFFKYLHVAAFGRKTAKPPPHTPKK